jgi:hypothetical protein
MSPSKRSLIVDIKKTSRILIGIDLLLTAVVVFFIWDHYKQDVLQAIVETTILSFFNCIHLFIIISLLDRIEHMENVIKLCAWTKKIELDGEWVTIEEFLQRELGVSITHGITREAAENLRKQFESEKAK